MTHRNAKSGKSSKSSLAKLVGQKTNPIEYQVLEARMVFDGAAAVTAADIANTGSDAAHAGAAADNSHAENMQDLVAALAAGGPAAVPGAPAQGSSSAIVFIDSAVTDPGVLANFAPAGAEVVVLDRGSDGLAQIAHYLEGRSGIDAIHIISHGHSGELTLGNAVVDENSIGGTHADELSTIRAALSEDADIALYGCSVGQGAEGQAFIDALSRATGADIAASVDDTGSVSHNANWNLEVRTGLIESGLIDAPEWRGILAPLEIRVSGNPVLANSAGGTSDPFNSVGNTALWTNAGTIGSTQIDVRATVLSTSAFNGGFPTYVDFITSNVEDLQLILWNGSATIKWEIFASGTNQLVYAVGSPNFSIRDLDGTGSAAFPALPAVELEAVSPQLFGLTSYTLEGDPAAPNTLNAGIVGTELIVAGTINRNLETNSMVTFSWTEVSSWVVKYTGQTAFINPDNTISPRFFYHDGDGDFRFVAPTTISMLSIDLDGNNSTATGASYQTTFTENGAAVTVVDSDVVIAQQAVLGTAIHEATVRLTNPQAGDALFVNGSAASSGTITAGASTLSYTVSSAGGQINVVFTGAATPADYQTALKTVTFSNSVDNLSGIDRSIEVFVKNTTFGTSSNQALSTIHVTPVNDAPIIDLNSAATPADAVRDNSVSFTEGGAPVALLAAAGAAIDPDGAEIVKLVVSATGFAADGSDIITIGGVAFIMDGNAAQSKTVTATIDATPFSGPGGTTFKIVYNAAAKTITITNNAGATVPFDAADFNLLLTGITFESTSEAPNTALSRTANFQVTDTAAAVSAVAVATIAVTPVNDPPVIDLKSDPEPVNILANSDFSSGATGWGSYIGAGNEFHQANITGGGFVPRTLYDHTTGDATGTYIVIDTGFPTGFTGTVLSQTVTLEAGKTYSLSAWATSLYPANAPVLEFAISGTVIANQTLSLATGGTWSQIAGTFTPATSGSYTLTMRDSNPIGSGNDFAVDDIILTELKDIKTSNAVTFVEGGAAVLVVDPTGSALDLDGEEIKYLYIQTNGFEYNGTEVLSIGGQNVTLDGLAAGSGTFNITQGATTFAVAYDAPLARFDITNAAGPTVPFSTTDLNALMKGITFKSTSDTPNGSLNRQVTFQVQDTSNAYSNAATTAIKVLPLNLGPHLDLGAETVFTATAAGTGGFLFGHQQGVSTDRNQASFAVLPANVTQVVGNEVAGAGISIDYSQGTHAAVTGLGSTSFDGAVSANDYISMSFTTTATQPESWITHVTKLNAGGPSYNFAIAISTDGFQTATLLSKDNPSPQNAAPANYAPNYPNFDGTDFKLTPGTTYEIRAYIYNVAGGAAATAKWDDFYVFFAADPAGNETTFTEGGTAVAITASGSEIEDVNNANMSSGLVTLTNKQTEDRLLISGVAVSNGSTGTIGGVGYTVTDTAGTISIALSGTATKAAYTAALNAITFENTSQAPSTVDRVINVTVNDGVETSNLATTIIHVVSVNDAPVNTVPAAQTVAEDGTLVFSTANGNAVTIADTDAGLGLITVDIWAGHGTLELSQITGLDFTVYEAGFTDQVGGSGARAVIHMTGTLASINAALEGLKYQPGLNYNGLDTLHIRTADNGNTGGTANTVLDTIAITVGPIADAVDDAVTTPEDTAITVTPIANDSFGGRGVVTSIGSASHGSPVLNADGTVTYTPNFNYNGTDSFTYTVTSNTGGWTYKAWSNPSTVGADPTTQTADQIFAQFPATVPDGAGNTMTLSPDGVPVIAGLTAQLDVAYQNQWLQFNSNLLVGQAGDYTFDVPPAPFGHFAVDDAVQIFIDGVKVYQLSDVFGVDGTASGIVNLAAGQHTIEVRYFNWFGQSDLDLTISGPDTANSPVDLASAPNIGVTSLTETATVNVTIDPVNDAPMIDLNSAAGVADTARDNAVTFTEGDTPKAVANITLAGVNDSGEADITSLTIIAAGVQDGVFEKVVIAGKTFDLATNSTQTATIGGTTVSIAFAASTGTFTITNSAGAATPMALPDLDTLIRGITYENTDQAPVAGARTLTFTATDAAGLMSAPAVATITVVPVNDNPVAANDTGSVSEDGPAATGNVITGPGTDTDVDGGPLSVTLADQAGTTITVGTPFTTAGGGVLTLNANGSYTFNPGTAYNGLDVTETATETIGYTISDGNGGTATATLVITIIGANDAPVVVDPFNPVNIPGNPLYDPANPVGPADPLNIIPDVSRNDGQALTPINAGATIVDPDGEPLTFTLDATAPAWLSIDPVTGIITGTPPADASQGSNTGNLGEYLITITAKDPDGALVSTTVTLSIVNLPPVAVNDIGSVSEDGTAATGNVLTDPATGDHDTAPDSDPLSVVAINGDPALVGAPVAGSTGGSFTLNPDGSWSFDPGHDFDNLAAGTTRDTVITYRVADGQGGTANATITVTVTGVNDAPVALGPIAPQTVTDDVAISPITTSVAFANPSNIPLTYTASNLPDGLAINPMTGVITGTPASDASVHGPYIVTVIATGPNGETSTVQLQLNVANPPPVAMADHTTTPAATPVTIAPLANDSDPDGDDLIITAITPPANGTAVINPDGTISYVPNAGFTGTETITYTVTDSQGGTTAAIITITVGASPADAPVVSGAIPPQAGTDDLPITPINAGSLFYDPNGGPLTFTATGLPPGLLIDPITGIITGALEPDASVDGPYAIAVTAVDPDGNQVTTTVLLAVLNPAPVAANDATATPMNTQVTIAVLANDTDPDGDVLHLSYVSDPAHGTVVINPDGTITYTPDAGFTGPDTFSYTVSDGQGGTDIATVTISVGVPLAGAPVAAGPLAPVTGIDGSPIAPVNIGSQITDPAGQPLTFSATGLPDGLVIDPLTGIITGTFEPGSSAQGPFTVLITAVDPDGNQITVPLVITTTNPAPMAGNDTATTAADQPVVIGVLANDSDPDRDVVTVTAATDPAHGSVVINPNGTITFTPDAGFTGTDTFTYTITDANGAAMTATVTVTIGTPGPLAAAPAITPVVGADGTSITPVAVGNAFGDPDQTGPLTLSIDPTALPPGITFDPATGTFSGTPATNASQGSTPGEPAGTYIVPVTATDSHGAKTTTYVTFTFANLPPVAVHDTATASEDAVLTTGNVLTDPVTGDHDTAPDSDPVTVTLANQGGRPIVLGSPFTVTGGGTLTLNANGSYTFNPGTAYNGLDINETATETIGYTISDGNGGTATATLVITVTGVNDAPVVVDPRNPGTPANPIPATDPLNIIPDVKTADGRSPPPINVANYIRDPEGKPLTFVATGLPPGLSINRNTGVIAGMLSHSASQGATPGNTPGVYSVTVTARDPGGLETTTTITYTVSNPPPVAVNDGPFVTDENRTVTVPVLGNDTDPDGDPLRVIAASSPNGSVTINGDGSLSFTPAPGFAGTALITYVISDGEGGTSLATVEVSVRPVVIGLSPTPVRPLPPAQLSPHEPISVDGAVIAAANSSYNLYGVGGTAGLSMANVIGDHSSIMGVINALDAPGSLWTIDQSGTLGGEPSFLTSDGIVLAESAHINGLWQAGDMLRSPDLSSMGLGTLGGFSIRFSTTQREPGAQSGPEVLVDSIVHNGVLTLTMEQSGMTRYLQVVDYRVTRLDGRSIPDWLERSSIDMLQGRRAADAEILDLRITAILSNGEAVTQDIRIQTMTGEIQPLPRQRTELSPPMFQDQFRSYASLSDRQSAALAYAIAD